MTTKTLEQMGELLREIGPRGTFTARRTSAVAEDLHLEVKGLGPLRFPISRTQAQRLCRLARPARYGKGEKTLLDPQVRDTWEVPKSRVKIDRRRWNRTLLPVLEALRSDLGLPADGRLKAELHSMLIYGPGQFFLPHQDSEKADEMVATLVVTLPAPFKGGAIIVEHQGEKVTYRASKKPLSFVAFYADCRHEVRPVKKGYRIVLTYNLMLAGDAAAASARPAAAPEPELADALAENLRVHFETPLPPRGYRQKDPRDPPNRLVYLLDHQYTQRGLGWQRLKGSDAARVAALRAAAERVDCEIVLALAEVHEIWGCREDDEGYVGHRRWERDEDDEEYTESPSPADGPDRYTLEDLHDWSITLHGWIDPAGKEIDPIVTNVDDEEVCSTTPSSDLEPYAAEYEGFMGNYGNTMDRWYRRAALVLWPRARAFAVRAEASPAWAMKALKERLQAGELSDARAKASSLLRFWEYVAPREEQRGFFDKAMHVAEGLDRSALAADLLRPFRIEALTPGRATAFAALVKRYGEAWGTSLLAAWSDPDRSWMRRDGGEKLKWLAALPRLCAAFQAADRTGGEFAARLLLQNRWTWLKETLEERRGRMSPRQRDKALTAMARPLLGFLESTAVMQAEHLRDEAIGYLSAAENALLLPCLLQVLRIAAKRVKPPLRSALGFDAVARHCTQVIRAQLESPERKADDWSIALPEGCHCKLCTTLGDFLTDPDTRLLEWRLAKEGRKHVHRRLDDHELPVRHETRRSGRPYTLVLNKTMALHERDATERRSRQADLEWLTGLSPSPLAGS